MSLNRYHNTLFVMTPKAYVALNHDTLEVKVGEESKIRVPLHHLIGLVCFGNVTVSPYAMHACTERGVYVSFLSETGRFLARVEGEPSGNLLLRKAQYRIADDEKDACQIARGFVIGKILNARHLVLRAAWESSEEYEKELRSAADRMGHAAQKAMACEDLSSLRGIEGDAAAVYFDTFTSLIKKDQDFFRMQGRNRRPPTDPINALLSFSYALLMQEVAGALNAVGLDPQAGFLHADRPGRLSLALDLMEEFRPAIADRLVLSCVNLGQMDRSSFDRSAVGGISLKDDARKAFLTAYQKRKEETLTHPLTGEETTIGLLPHIQARLLARTIRGELDSYPPFLAKWRLVVLVTYDVATTTSEGRRRLRRVSTACESYGQRVQFSVFECDLGDKDWAELRNRLLTEFNPKEDSLRFYFLGEKWASRTEHHGVKPSLDFHGTLIV